MWSQCIPGAFPRKLGDYEILAKLGGGGMGVVYRARHVRLEKIVALKVLAPHRVEDMDALARSERQMIATGGLKHPNLADALDARVEDGRHFVVMEYIDGVDSARLMDSRGPLPVADACEIIRQAALGLEHAHQYGLIHGDIKPANLMLTREGKVKVLDLGLAHLRGDPKSQGPTMAGTVLGTPDYIAPEQFLGTASDIRMDIYSLGCMLFHFVAGKPPFSGPEYDTPGKKVRAQLDAPFPLLADLRAEVPLALVAILNRMVAKNPDERLATPGEAAGALLAFAAGCDLQALIGNSCPEVGQLPDDSGTIDETALSGFRALVRDIGRLEEPNASSAAELCGLEPISFSSEFPQRIGDFEMIREIGCGGMGQVFLARQVSLNREVALKVLSSAVEGRPDALARFLREAKAAAGVNHPSIVPVLEAGIADGRPYIAMQLVRGPSLLELLRQGGPLPVEEALHIVLEAARALHAAHEAGVIHRDVKPGNILVEAGEHEPGGRRVFVADFGLAHLAEGTALTGSGAILGTAAYMAPEQARGFQATHLSDVYSLGATLYHLLSGRATFEGSPLTIVVQLVQRNPIPLKKLNRSVDRDATIICEKAMRWHPKARYQSAAEMAADIERRLEHRPIHARAASWAYRSRLWLRRNPGAVLSAAVMLLAALGALLGYQVYRRQEGLTETRKKLTDGDFLIARETLEDTPRLPWPLTDDEFLELSVQCKTNTADLEGAVKDALRLPVERQKKVLDAVRSVIGKQLKSARAIAAHGIPFTSAQVLKQAVAGLAAMLEDAGGPSAVEKGALDEALEAARLVLLQGGRYGHEESLDKVNRDDGRSKADQLARVLEAAFKAQGEGNPVRGQKDYMLRTRASETETVLATTDLANGLSRENARRLLEYARLKLQRAFAPPSERGTVAGQEAQKREALAVFLTLDAYGHVLEMSDAEEVRQAIEMLSRLRPAGETKRIKGRLVSSGDLDGDGASEAVFILQDEVKIFRCAESGLELLSSFRLEEARHIAAAACLDVSEQKAKEIVVVYSAPYAEATRRESGGKEASFLRVFRYDAVTGEVLSLQPPHGPVDSTCGPHNDICAGDTNGDYRAEVFVGLSSVGQDGRQVWIIREPLGDAQKEPEFLDSGGERADVFSVVVADFDGDKKSEPACVTERWQGYDIRFWKFMDGKYQGPMRFGPLSAFQGAMVLHATDTRAALFLAGGSRSRNDRIFRPPLYTGIPAGAYYFEIPAGMVLERGHYPPLQASSLFKPLAVWDIWDVNEDDYDGLLCSHLSTGGLLQRGQGVAVSWVLRRAGRQESFVDLYVLGNLGAKRDVSHSQLVFWEKGPRAVKAEIVLLSSQERGSSQEGLLVSAEDLLGEAQTEHPVQLWSLRREVETFELQAELELIEAFARAERFAQAARMASSRLQSAPPHVSDDFALAWMRSASRDLDWPAVDLAIKAYRGKEDRVREWRALSVHGRALGAKAPSVILDAGPDLERPPAPFEILEDSSIRLSFEIELTRLPFSHPVFIGLFLAEGPPAEECAWGVQISYGGGGGDRMIQAYVRWGRAQSSYARRSWNLKEEARYSINLERTSEGRVHLKVAELPASASSTAALCFTVGHPPYDPDRGPREYGIPKDGVPMGPIKKGKYLFGARLLPSPYGTKGKPEGSYPSPIELRLLPVSE